MPNTVPPTNTPMRFEVLVFEVNDFPLLSDEFTTEAVGKLIKFSSDNFKTIAGL